MARGGGRSSGGGKRVSSGRFGAGRDPSSIVRDSRGRFAYTGGRKKPPRRLRRRKGTVDSTAVSNAATALSKAESKSVSRKQLEALKKSVGGVRPKRKVVTGSNVDKAKQVLGGLESKTVSKKQLEAIAKQVGGLQPVKVVTAAGNPESRGIATIRSSALGVKDRIKRKQATPVAQPDTPKATAKATAPKATSAKPKEPQATQPKPTGSQAAKPKVGVDPGTKKLVADPSRKVEPKPSSPAPTTGTGPKFPLDKNGKIRVAPTERNLATEKHLDITDDGKIRLWEGSKHDLKNNRGYKEGVDAFEYAPLDANGKRRVVPPDGNVKSTFEGEVVHNIPKHPDFKQMSDKALVNALADRMSRVETADKGGASAGAPKVNGDRFEIHHINQWAKRDFREITLDYQAGRISLDEAKAEMGKLLAPASDSREGFRIDLAPKGERRLIVLRNSYHMGKEWAEINHPRGIHPVTGEPTLFGIPKKGDGSREWFNGWRDRFWTAYNRVEAYAAAKELERRIKKGGLTPEEARKLWHGALESQQRNLDYQTQWREARRQQSKAAKSQT